MKKSYTLGLASLVVTLAKKQTTKRIGFVAGLLLAFGMTAFSQTYYYLRTDSLKPGTTTVVKPATSSVKAWTTDPGGTITAPGATIPANFTADGQIFVVQTNGYTNSNAKGWVISGVGSKLVIGTNDSVVTFTSNSNSSFTGTVDVVGKSTFLIEVANTSTINLGKLDVGSTVRFGGNSNGSIQQVIPFNYQNLSLASAGTAYAPVTLPQATIGVAGVFTPRVSNMYGSTIDFNGGGGQTIPGGTYYNLTISGNKSVSDSLKGTINIAGKFSDNSTGAALVPYTLGLTNGVPTPAASTLNYLGLSTPQSLGNQSLYNLTFSNGIPLNVTTMNYANSTITLAQANPELAVGQKVSLNTLNIKSNSITLDTTAVITAINNDTVITLSKPVEIRLFVNPVGHAPGTNVDTVYATSYDPVGLTVTLDPNGSYPFNVNDTIKGQLFNGSVLLTAVNGNVLTAKSMINAYNIGTISIGSGNDAPVAKTITGTVNLLGTFTPSIGTITTTGTTFNYHGKRQNIAGGANLVYNNLVINQDSATTAALAASTVVEGTFTLQSGKLTTNTTTKLLTLGENATFTPVTNDTFFVNGGLAKKFASTKAFTYKVGTVVAGAGIPRTVTVTPLTADAKTYTVNYGTGKTSNATRLDTSTVSTIDTLSFYNVALSGYTPGVDTSAQLSFELIPSSYYQDSSITLAHYFHGKYTADAPLVTFTGTTPLTFTTWGYDSTFGRYVLATASASLVPVKFGTVSASLLANKSVKISWESYTESSVSKYVVEGSTDGINFSTKGSLPAKGAAQYSFIDNSASAGVNYYRIKAVDVNGKLTYSSVVTVKQVGLVSTNISVYPNPVKNKQLNFVLSTDASNYTLRVTSILGATVVAKTINHNGGTASYSVALPSNLAKGTYFVKLSNGKDQLTKTITVE